MVCQGILLFACRAVFVARLEVRACMIGCPVPQWTGEHLGVSTLDTECANRSTLEGLNRIETGSPKQQA